MCPSISNSSENLEDEDIVLPLVVSGVAVSMSEDI